MLIAFVLGVLSVLAFAPFHFWYILPITTIGIYLLLENQASHVSSMLVGFFYGLGLFIPGLGWIFNSFQYFSSINTPIAVVVFIVFIFLLAFLFSIFFLFYSLFFKKRSASIFSFSVLWVIFEWLRGWLFTGFPWLYWGYSFTEIELSKLGLYIGVFGVSFIIVFYSISLYFLCILRLYLKGLLFTISLIFLSLLPDATEYIYESGSIEVLVVQPNVPQNVKWNENKLKDLMDKMISMTDERSEDVDLILWPETAIPSRYGMVKTYVEKYFGGLNKDNIYLLSGFIYSDNSNEILKLYNSLGVFSGVNDVYHKKKLIPLGEYNPFEGNSFISGLIGIPDSKFSFPNDNNNILKLGDVLVGARICYEVTFSESTRKAAKDSNVIINVANDAWFGISIGPYQHLQIARWRSIENGRQLIRSANNGISAIIDYDGSVISSINLDDVGSISKRVSLYSGYTPYQRIGDFPILFSLILVLCIIQLIRNDSS